MGARKYWVDWYPVKERILDGCSLDTPLLIDIGGGKGHDLVQFDAKFPGHKLILQEVPEVIANLRGSDQVFESFVYDILTKQPLKGKFE